MRPVVLTKTYAEPPVCEREILRYALCREEDDDVVGLMRSALAEVREKLVYTVCYTETDVKINGSICDLGLFAVNSRDLAKDLTGCESALLFGATVGVELDRLIAKYGRISPSRALMLQAIGAERIEALCDVFCSDIADGRIARPRFSPGYGDLSLEVQRDIFSILDPGKRIGLFLTESMLMSPSKSVTAIMGICGKDKE